MTEDDKKLEREAMTHRLEEAAARLRAVRAEAEEHKAEGAMAEVSGLSALHEKVRKQMSDWNRADKETWDELKSAVARGIDQISKHLRSASERLTRLDEANDRRMDAEIDLIAATNDIIAARIAQGWVEDKKDMLEASEQLAKEIDQIKQKRQQLHETTKEGAAKARASLEEQLDALKRRCIELAHRLKGPQEKPAQPL
jgi:hypothetical protein